MKKDAQVDGLNQGKGNKFRSQVRGRGHGHGQRQSSSQHDTSGPKPGGPLPKLWNQAPTKAVPCFQKTLLLLQERRSFLQVLSCQSTLPVSTAQEEGHE